MREYVKKLHFIMCCMGMLALAACKDPSFFQALGEKIVADTLSISPSSVTVPVNGTVTFGASGGVQPYTYSVVPARVGAIDPTSGAYAAPTTQGTETVRVTDHKGRTADAKVTTAGNTGALSIQPSTVSINVGGSVTFVATGGSGTYNYTMLTSASGPPVSVVAATGVYTAGNSGSTTDVVRVSDGITFKDATINVTATNSPVNYDISPVSAATLPAAGTGNTLLGGSYSFTIHNGGTGAGSAPISWWVFLSPTPVPGSGSALLASGSYAGPAIAPGLTAAVPLSWTWPSVLPPGGIRYLFIMISAADDLTPANNTYTSAALTLSKDNVHYTVSGVTNTGGITAGGALTGQFTVQNSLPGATDGHYTANWKAYVSTDGTQRIDAGAVLVSSGSIPPLNGGASSAPVSFSGTWPAAPGAYFLKVQVSAPDEVSPDPVLPAAAPWGNTGVTATSENTTVPDYDVPLVTNTGSAMAGRALSGSFTLHNGGSANGTKTVNWTVFVSTDAVLDAGDTAVAAGTTGPLNAGTSQVGIPFSGTWPSATGSFYLIVKVAAADDMNPANDVGASAIVPVSLADVNYSVTAVNNTGLLVSGGSLAGNFTLLNNGSVAGYQDIHWTVYVSTDIVLDAGDTVVASGTRAPLGASPASAVIPFTGTWPSSFGTRFLIVKAEAGDDVPLGAGKTGVSAAVTVTHVDYAVNPVNLLTGTTAGAPFTANFTASNNGDANGSANLYWSAYASFGNNQLDVGDSMVDSGFIPGGLAAGGSQVVGFGGNWPSTVGNYNLIVSVSASDEQPGLQGNNQKASAPATSVVAPDVKYRVTAVTNTPPSTAGSTINGGFTLNNFGSAGGTQTVFWTAYVSTDPTNTIDGSAKVVDSGTHAAVVAGGSPVQTFAGTWPATAGTYYLKVSITAADDTTSGDDIKASASVTTTVPDYDVSAVTNTGTAMAGRALSGTFTLHNGGSANGTKTVSWTVFVSTDAILDAGDTAVAAGTTGPLNAGTSQVGIPFSGTWPSATGSFFLIVKAAAADDTNPANDTGAVGPISVVAPDVNYSVTPVNSTGLLVSGGSLAGNFTLHNLGSVTGIQTVHWVVYASPGNTVIDGADTVVASGSVAALGAGGTQAGIGFTGTWPAAFGTYYLIVLVTAGDDQPPGGKTGASVALTVTRVDYAVTAVNFVSGTAAGAPFTANFTVRNNGDASGTQNLYWSAYASLTNSTLDAGDTLIASNFISGGLASGTQQVIGFGGSWPSNPANGNYYLIVSVSAADESTGLISDDTNHTVAAVAVVPPNVDYIVVPLSVTGTMVPPVAPATPVSGTFQYKNQGLNNGSQWVSWAVYASPNPTLDSYAITIASGMAPPLNAGQPSGAIPFSGTWPLTYGNYYLLVWVGAQEDVNPGNNTAASVGTSPVGIYTGIVQLGNPATWTNFTDLTGVKLQPGMTIAVHMTSMPSYLYQLLQFNTGTANAFTATWSIDVPMLPPPGNNTPDLGLLYYTAPGVLDGVQSYWLASVNSISIRFIPDAQSQVRMLGLYNARPKVLTSNTLIISAE